MVTFDGLQYTSLTGETLYSQGLVLHQCIFLRSSDTSTLPIHRGCVNCIRASFSPAAPTATNGLASRRSNASVPPTGSLRYQHHSWLKYLRVVGVNPLPALPLPFSLNKPRGLRLDPLVLHQDQCLSCTNSQERVRKYLFFFSLFIRLLPMSVPDVLPTSRYQIPSTPISRTLPTSRLLCSLTLATIHLTLFCLCHSCLHKFRRWTFRCTSADHINILTMYWCPEQHPQLTPTHNPLPQSCIGLYRHGRSCLAFVCTQS